MNKIQLEALPTRALLFLFADVMEELRRRDVVRSSNNPVADYTEWLVARSLSLKLRPGSSTGFDAEDKDGKRYEIKGRRLTEHNGVHATQCHPRARLAALRLPGRRTP